MRSELAMKPPSPFLQQCYTNLSAILFTATLKKGLMKKLLLETLGWGFLLWLIGYILGFVFFAFVPPALLGWVISPIGTAITLFVLFKKIDSHDLSYYLKLGIVWAVIAVVCDYLFLVQLLKPADGYYKLDVYLYYALTLLLPIGVGVVKKKRL